MWHRKAAISLVTLFAFMSMAGGVGFAKDLTGKNHWSGKVELQEPVVVMPGATLTVAAGTRIEAANPQVKISVRGRIDVQGTSAQPVIFAGATGWQGIEFMEAPAGSSIRGATFTSATAAISSFATDFLVENCTFNGNEFGVRLLRESHPVIVNSSFDGNQVGVANEMKSSAEVKGNRFANHSRTAILASHSSKGAVSGNSFAKNKHGITLLQRYPDKITDNSFVENEVGIYCNQTQSTPLIEQNLFEKNAYGILNFSFAYPVIRNNRFVSNKTAVHNDQYGSPLVENNLFRENDTALYNYRKSNPKVQLNSFEDNQLALFCDFSAYPEVKNNHFLGNRSGVELGLYQSADWEKRSGSKPIMQREASARQSQNPLLAKAPDSFSDFVDVSGNWWGDDTAKLARAGKDGNSDLFYDRHDKPEVTYEDYGPGVYRLDRVEFSPWLEAPVSGVGPLEQ